MKITKKKDISKKFNETNICWIVNQFEAHVVIVIICNGHISLTSHRESVLVVHCANSMLPNASN